MTTETRQRIVRAVLGSGGAALMTLAAMAAPASIEAAAYGGLLAIGAFAVARRFADAARYAPAALTALLFAIPFVGLYAELAFRNSPGGTVALALSAVATLTTIAGFFLHDYDVSSGGSDPASPSGRRVLAALMLIAALGGVLAAALFAAQDRLLVWPAGLVAAGTIALAADALTRCLLVRVVPFAWLLNAFVFAVAASMATPVSSEPVDYPDWWGWTGHILGRAAGIAIIVAPILVTHFDFRRDRV